MPPDSIGSWTLATVAMWCDQCPDACHELMAKKLNYDLFYEDGISVINGLKEGGHPHLKHIPRSHDKVITPEVAKNIMEAVNHLRNDNLSFHVPGESLKMIPGIIMTGSAASDNTAVATRLDSLERSQERLVDFLREEVAKIKNEIQVRQAAPAPAPAQVQPPALQVNGAPAPTSFRQLGATPKTYTQRGPSRKRAKSEADAGAAAAGAAGGVVAAAGGGAAAPGGGAAAGGGGAAAGGGGGWNEVVKRKGKQKPKGIQGNNRTAAAVSAAAAAVRPVDFYIGGTDPRSTPELIKDILIKVARSMPAGMELGCELEIEKVTLLTKPGEGNTRFYSKSWQVTVPEKFREHMMRAESIPAGWHTRRFYPPRQKRAPLNPLQAQVDIVQQAQAQAGAVQPQPQAQPQLGDKDYVPPGLPGVTSRSL